MNRFVWPLVGFVVLVVLLAVGLNLNPRDLPSPLVGKPAPMFTLPRLAGAGEAEQTFSPKDMLGRVWLMNVWASWCVSCRQEHPQLVQMQRAGKVTLVGLNYKEVRGDADYDPEKIGAQKEKTLARERSLAWLKQHGDPYTLVAVDLDGRVGIDYGVYGVPETYVIDKAGVIRLKQTGPITPEVYNDKILPLVAELSK
jgi:cytochrome c biogenesis protein CcmG/thiol:disulfide interchange protein DsbE